MRMKQLLVVATTIVALVMVAAPSARAQCDFNGTSKGKFKSDMVRAYSSCPGVTFPSPNSSTRVGVPACATPVPRSVYKFGEKGKCSVSAGAKLEDPCKDGSGIPCSNTTVKAKCSGITESDGTTPVSGSGWSLTAVLRTTTNDNSSGDMTIIDFPVQFVFAPASKGKIGLSSDTNNLLASLFGPGAALPGCSSSEILSLAVQDPNGDAFAVPGVSTR